MPNVQANGQTINYEQTGSGPPIVLIPYLAADNACYAFQVGEYAKHYTCISVDLRGTGASSKPSEAYTTETLADDVAAVMTAIGVERAHVAGLSLGGAVGLWLAAKYPDKVRSLSVHDSWHKSDAFLKTVIQNFQLSARALDSVPEMIIQSIFPWCFSPELYEQTEYIANLAGFVRSRPAQPLASFNLQSNAVMAHDVSAQLGAIKAPTQITYGSLDLVTSARFAKPMSEQIKGSEVVVFEGCAHAPIYERVEEFNTKTLAFLNRH